MASVNKVVLVGNLGKDPAVRFTPSGRAVCKFPLATSEVWNTDAGKQEHTEWHHIVVWGKSAENCGQFLRKGRQVYVEGAIRSRSYDAKDGAKRYVTEIITQRVQFLGGRPTASSSVDTSSDTDGFSGGEGDDFSLPPAMTDDETPF